jgi:hypothetical protein
MQHIGQYATTLPIGQHTFYHKKCGNFIYNINKEKNGGLYHKKKICKAERTQIMKNKIKRVHQLWIYVIQYLCMKAIWYIRGTDFFRLMGPTKYISNSQIYIVIIPAPYTIYWTKISLSVTQSIIFKLCHFSTWNSILTIEQSIQTFWIFFQNIHVWSVWFIPHKGQFSFHLLRTIPC